MGPFLLYLSRWDVASLEVVGVCCASLVCFLFRVTDITFSKCSDGDFGVGTQALNIRHPWLRFRSRQRPVAELLGNVQNIKKM